MLCRTRPEHPVLGPRLSECAEALNSLETRSATGVLGSIDAQKLQSSMTLFLRAEPESPVFRQVLDQYFEGATDAATDQLLGELT